VVMTHQLRSPWVTNWTTCGIPGRHDDRSSDHVPETVRVPAESRTGDAGVQSCVTAGLAVRRCGPIGRLAANDQYS
jgi:hypothetical protein